MILNKPCKNWKDTTKTGEFKEFYCARSYLSPGRFEHQTTHAKILVVKIYLWKTCTSAKGATWVMQSFIQSTEKYCNSLWLRLGWLRTVCWSLFLGFMLMILLLSERGLHHCCFLYDDNMDCLMLASFLWYYRMLQKTLASSTIFLGKCTLQISW